MANDKLPANAEGLFRFGKVVAVGENARGESEISLHDPDNPSYPSRVVIRDKFSRTTGAPLTVDGLKAGTDFVAVQVDQEVVSAKGFQPFVAERVIGIFVVGQAPAVPGASGAHSAS